MRASNVTVRRRLFTALIIGTIIFTALIIRLAYVQLWIGQDLADLAEDSWRREISFAPKRGEIQDRNGMTLTYSMSTPTLVAIPVQIIDAHGTAAKLAKVLDGNEDDIYKQITKKASQNYIKPSGRK